MSWTFEREVTSSFAQAESLEWLETNGLGGWASSTVSGAHSRRYHGLLVAATTPPTGRLVLLSRLDETIVTAGGRHDLGANRFPGAIHPQGYRSIERFVRGTFPVFDYAAGGVGLRKTIAAVDGENTTVVLYELLEAAVPVTLELRPFFAGRDYHALVRANDAVAREARFAEGVLAYRAYEGQPVTWVLAGAPAAWIAEPDWWHDFEYARERERGLDFREDLFTPGRLSVELEPGATLGVIVSTDDPSGRDGRELLERERRRRAALLAPWSAADPLCRALVAAADCFVVRRGSDLRTIIAGYPWFTDWGRDTMIALPGLCLTTGRFDDARRILRAFARAADRGMLPNRFPDRGETPELNTADASLWLFVAVRSYRVASGDAALARELLPVLRDVVSWHRRGTRYGIGEDGDGLLRAGEPGTQLTWMDAKVGDRVVTPRRGKPVEINALWYNALCILAALERDLGDATAAPALDRLARRVRRRFTETFWDAEVGYLADVVDGDTRDWSLRPNQLFALSLPFPLLSGAPALSVLDAVERHLLTPVGLRSLAPSDPRYVPRYEGGVGERDGAYHQGTVWAWLLGPYVTALVRLRGAVGRRAARELLRGLERHLGEACVGQISEIFDAEPPHAPRGCPAQAWSVAEVLRAAVESAGLAGPEVAP